MTWRALPIASRTLAIRNRRRAGPILWAAELVTIGLAISLIPILLGVRPPLAKDAATNERDPDYTVTVLGLVLYVGAVAGVLVLLEI